MQALVIIIIAVVAIAIFVGAWYAASLRRKELSAWAQSRGLQFTDKKLYDLDDEFANFKCLRQGSSRYAYNIISGRLGEKEFLGFDYHYTTGSGKDQQTHIFSAIIVQSPMALKPLFIRPENFLDKVAEFAGFNDIDFESAEFSRKFYIKSPDKKWAYDVIHPQMMEFLLGSPVFTIQFDSAYIMAMRDTTFKAEDFESACCAIEGMIERFPQYLVKEQKGV